MKNEKYVWVIMSCKMDSVTINIGFPNKIHRLIFESLRIQGEKRQRKVRLFSKRRGMGLYTGEPIFGILRCLSIRINKKVIMKVSIGQK